MIIVAFRNFICFIGLLLASPIICIAAFCIFLEDGFPIFFKQQRIGKKEKPFTIYKIRTMPKNTPEVGTHIAEQEFKLKTGVFIRKTKLDELHQLINVIKGDINLVGPRPSLYNQTELRNARSVKNIFDAKPGITGLAQVLNYDMSNPLKLAEIDNIYINNQSFKMNVIILMATFFEYPKRYLRKKFIK